MISCQRAFSGYTKDMNINLRMKIACDAHILFKINFRYFPVLNNIRSYVKVTGLQSAKTYFS